jgi:hypothetical protein
MLGERMQITRLLSNLLDNAIKYVPAGGRIGLSLMQGPRIVIEDNGPGIAHNQRERIFERFVRATAPVNNPAMALASPSRARSLNATALCCGWAMCRAAHNSYWSLPHETRCTDACLPSCQRLCHAFARPCQDAYLDRHIRQGCLIRENPCGFHSCLMVAVLHVWRWQRLARQDLISPCWMARQSRCAHRATRATGNVRGRRFTAPASKLWSRTRP